MVVTDNTSNQTVLTKYYNGNYEKENTNNRGRPVNRELTYLAGGDGLCAIWVKNNGRDTLYYVYTDHLGSITTVTDDQGNVLENRSYDAWGRRRKPDTWDYYPAPSNGHLYIPPPPSLLFARGFTGHEDLPWFGLINMNARLYDPLLGRVLSPDNLVQAADNSQSYNRYSYCINNPLRYTDPTGYFTWQDALAIGEIIGGVALYFIPYVGPALGASIGNYSIISGISHFGMTLQNMNSQGGWNNASNNAGVMFGVSTTIDSPVLSSVPTSDNGNNEPNNGLPNNASSDGINWSYVNDAKADMSYDNQHQNDVLLPTGTDGGVWTVGVSATASAGVGGSIDVGATFDFNNGFHFSPYITLSETYGVDLSGGVKVTDNIPGTNSSFGISNIGGWSESYNGSIGPLDGSYGGNSFRPGLDPANFSSYHANYTTYGGGLSLSPLPGAFTINKGYTWVFWNR